MSTYTDFPSDEDIQEFLQSRDFQIPCGVDFEGYGDLAKREFERRTDRIPFLKDAEDVDRFYDPPTPSAHGQKLFLDAGLLELTSLVVGFSPSNDGQELTLNTDFVLQDYNAPVEDRPYETIEFLSSFPYRHLFYPVPFVGGLPRSIKVTGKWGYSATVPEDVYFAALRIGAGMVLADLRESLSTEPVEWAEADVRERLSIELIQRIGSTYDSYVSRVVARYRFIS